jgi:hypothetical protein
MEMDTKSLKFAAIAGVGTLLLATGGAFVQAGNVWQGLAVIIVGLVAYIIYEKL